MGDSLRGEAGEPVLRDALVGYCAAFENALKAVALAFRVADACKENASASFVEGAKLKKMRRDVGDCWKAAAKSAAGGEPCGAERFYVDYVFKKNPCPDKWPFKQPSDVSFAKYNYWPDVAMAFKLRNKILHQNGYLDERLEIAGQVMHESAEVQLEMRVVNRVDAAFRSLLDPMDTESMARQF